MGDPAKAAWPAFPSWSRTKDREGKAAFAPGADPPGGRAGPRPVWSHRFRVGDEVRTVGGSGSYDRGRIVEVAQRERYYRVDYGLGHPSTIREENLEAFDESNPVSGLPRGFVPPILPFSLATLWISPYGRGRLSAVLSRGQVKE